MTKILRGHFEMTVIDHFETIEVAVAHFEKIVIYHFEGTVCFRTFKGSFMLLYDKSIGSFRRENHFLSFRNYRLSYVILKGAYVRA